MNDEDPMIERRAATRVAEAICLSVAFACIGVGCGSTKGSNAGSAGASTSVSSGGASLGGSSSSNGGSGLVDTAAAGGSQPPGGGASGSGTVSSAGDGGGTVAPVSCALDLDAGAPLQADAGIAPLPNLALPYVGTFSKPPSQTDTQETTDAPLLGNGDLGVAVLGSIDAMTFILAKNEFWSLQGGSVKAMARLSLSIPGMAGASYSMTEKIGTGQVTGTFAKDGNTLTTTSWVQATDTTNNQFFTQIANAGASALPVSVSIAPGHKNSAPSSAGSSADVLYEDVQGDTTDMVGDQLTRKVRVATRVIGTAGAVANGALSFTLAAGQKVVLATAVMSNVDSPAMYQTQAVSNVTKLAASDVDTLSTAHQAWWDSFYRKSFVQLQDKTLEKQYYASLYLLACTSRTGEASSGLWGVWVMTDPAWFGDYTLNYNYEAPFFAAFPTNHVELADSYDKPLLDWLPHAQAQAASHGWKGAFYRVHIGPLPNGSADTSEHNQKSIGAWAATDLIMHYYYTLDPAYASTIYPSLKQMAVFWESYLVKNGSTYDIVNDAQQEDDPSPQTNGVMSLGLVRMLLQACIDVSTALNLDTDERAVWQDRLKNLSPFPTFMMGGKTVFRWTSLGRDWDSGNDIGIQHVYPAGQIGLSSDPVLLQTANNMVDAMARWNSGGGNVTFFPAAARVGYDPVVILTKLASWVQNNAFRNLHTHEGGGGIENFNTVPSTVTEMMLQSFQGTLRIFANWPKGSDAKFASLRAYGAFIVSSEIQSDVVPYIRIVSEHGGPFTLANPWTGKSMVVYRNGVNVGMLSGASVTIQSCVGDSIFLAPVGASYASLVALANAQ
jgi:alpha-L-fucosidase 2